MEGLPQPPSSRSNAIEEVIAGELRTGRMIGYGCYSSKGWRKASIDEKLNYTESSEVMV